MADPKNTPCQTQGQQKERVYLAPWLWLTQLGPAWEIWSGEEHEIVLVSRESR